VKKRVGLFGPTRFGNSLIETDSNFRWRSERARGGEGRFLRYLSAGCQSERGRNGCWLGAAVDALTSPACCVDAIALPPHNPDPFAGLNNCD
jgi:hypothetical protein